MFVKVVDISGTLCCVESSNWTCCKSLLDSDTLMFPFTTWFTTSDPRGPHLWSSLLGVALGERQRVGTIPAVSAIPLEGDCILVAAGLSSFGVVWSMSTVGLGDLGVAGLDSTLVL